MRANKLELIESVEVTSSTATVTLGGANWNNTYDSYMVILDGVTNDSADEIQLHLLDSSNAEITGASDYSYSFQRSTQGTSETTVKNTNTDDIQIGTTGTGTGAMFGAEFLLQDFNDATKVSTGHMDCVFQDADGKVNTETGGFFMTSASLNKGLLFRIKSNNNFLTGRFTIYGIGS